MSMVSSGIAVHVVRRSYSMTAASGRRWRHDATVGASGPATLRAALWRLDTSQRGLSSARC
eukprot:2029035-Prymnesium_polylepis.5